VQQFDWEETKRTAAKRLLSWPDTAVIQDATVVLISHESAESIASLCVALAQQDQTEDVEAQETILGGMSTAWRSGSVDVPSLLSEIRRVGGKDARRGAALALDWLGAAT
jgi:hypothetical protein